MLEQAMALTVTKMELGDDGNEIGRTLLPYRSETKQENVEVAKREAMKYVKWGECEEQGYFWAKDARGKQFRFIP
jgi:hypothetical protein